MKPVKTLGPDITAEIISTSEECGIQQVTWLLNTIYDEIRSDLCKCIFIAIPKKSGVLECYHH